MLPPPPQQAALTESGKRTTFWWLQWFSQLFETSKNVVDFTQTDIQAPLTGFSIVISPTTQVLTLNPSTALASGAIVLPPNPANGAFVLISSTATILMLSLTASGSEIVANAPASIIAGTGFSYYYSGSNNTWFKVS